MDKSPSGIRWQYVVLVILAIAGMSLVARHRLRIETDITQGLPRKDPVLIDARYIITHYPVFDRVFIDIGLVSDTEDDGALLSAAEAMEQGLRDSNLFTSVGTDEMSRAMPVLLSTIVSNLSLLFSREDLETAVEPLTGEDSIRTIMEQNMAALGGFEGFGQADLISRDPLGLRNIVLARLEGLMPVRVDVVFRHNHIFSRDRRHILLMAEPAHSATDSSMARKIHSLISDLTQRVEHGTGEDSRRISVTPMGSYRSALDNETIARSDTMRAVLLATIGIALLLVLSFPRWYIGLLALVPAIAGTTVALFVLSLFRESLSILAIGFGGAIISINVDYGIAYLLFLDRTYATDGRHASRESWWVGLGASFTTVGSFLALTFSGFPILEDIGLFTALGTLCSFIFVHSIFPIIFRRMPPARREGIMLMDRFSTRVVRSSGWGMFAATAVFGVVMAFLARPEIRADVEGMNTVSADTRQAEEAIKKTWGSIADNTYLLIEGRSLDAIRDKADRLEGFVKRSVESGILQSGHSLSSFLPGKALAKKNSSAWREFWTPERTRSVKNAIQRHSAKLGFSNDAFNPFYSVLLQARSPDIPLPQELYGLFGITRNRDTNEWMMMSTVSQGPRYDAGALYKDLTDSRIGTMLDARWFTQRLSNVLFAMFVKMGILCGVGLLIVIVPFLLDIRLIALALAPIVFALVSACATLRLLHHPLDIPGLLLIVVVFGMGIDYPIYFIGSRQRYFDEAEPGMTRFHTAVFMNAGSTIIGLAMLALAGHALLRSAGLSMVLGLVYALVGTVTLLPPVLRVLYSPSPPMTAAPVAPAAAGSKEHKRLVLSRYNYMETYVRMFARFKMRLDPMFPGLAEFVAPQGKILDIGCGYGVPAAWLMTLYPRIQITGIDPDPVRARVAKRVLGPRARVIQGRAPALPPLQETYDTALLLDIIHYLDDDELFSTLRTVHGLLNPGSSIVIRVTVPTSKALPWERRLELLKSKFTGAQCHFRPCQEIEIALSKTGFSLTSSNATAPGREETWFLARRP